MYLGLAVNIRDGLDICCMNKIEQLSLIIRDVTVKKDIGLKERICEIVNDLIANDFNQLVQFLYHVDVNEDKLKKLLHDNPQTDAAILITDLLIERQVEKIKVKASISNQEDIPDEEKW